MSEEKKSESNKKADGAKSKAITQEKRPRLFVGIQGEPSSYREVQARGVTSFHGGESKKGKRPQPAPKTNPAVIINRNPHNETLVYGKHQMVVAPRSRKQVADYTKLGPLPQGVTVIVK